MEHKAALPHEGTTDESTWWVAAPDQMALLKARYVRQAFPRHSHEDFVICVDERGAHLSWYRGGTVTIGEGFVAVIPPGEVHTGQPIPGRAWHYRAMYPSPDLLRGLGEEVGLPGPGLPAFPDLAINSPMLADAFLRAHRLCETAPDPLVVESTVIDFLLLLLQTHASHGVTSRAPGTPFRLVRRALDCIHDQYAERLTLEMLATAAGLTRGALLRGFQREVGMPPYSYLTQVRIDKAKRLLLAGHPIATVAQSVGFADQSHLTRHFKRLVGVTPGLFTRATLA
jgi:AraC-like DNA-binding protein